MCFVAWLRESSLGSCKRLDIRIFHPGQTILRESEYGEMTYILVHGEAVDVDDGPNAMACVDMK